MLAGGEAEILHVNRVLESPQRLADFQIVCVPGGFSYGDDIAAGRIFGNQLQHHLADALATFHDSGKLILGICNGFQVLLKTNLLLPAGADGPTATLAFNDSGHFEARWVTLGTAPGKCVFLQGVGDIELPVAHAEGKFVPRDADVLASYENAGQVVLRYQAISDCGVRFADSQIQSEIRSLKSETPQYPDNPNGSINDIAGVCDETGRVFGLMPHPERFVDPTQHPRWTRGPEREFGDGLRVFQNAVRFFL
jgi:phosphoribosylformylglycinamidine synthase